MGLQIETGIDHRAQGLRILFTGETDKINRCLESAIVESFQQTPVTDARTVFITRFDVEVAIPNAGADRDIGNANFGAVVTV